MGELLKSVGFLNYEFRCVECGNCVSRSIETESYNKPGAIKRTMITFVAQSTVPVHNPL